MIGERVAVLLLAVLGAVAAVAVAAVGAGSDSLLLSVVGADGHRRLYAAGVLARWDGAGPERWWNRYRAERRQVAALRRQLAGVRTSLRREQHVLLSSPAVGEAIDLACVTYGNCSTLWRKARCETGGTFDPHAWNRSGASGLFQFLGSTWDTTPYARFSVWSPYANALAAGWMHAHGRGGEWSCR